MAMLTFQNYNKNLFTKGNLKDALKLTSKPLKNSKMKGDCCFLKLLKSNILTIKVFKIKILSQVLIHLWQWMLWRCYWNLNFYFFLSCMSKVFLSTHTCIKPKIRWVIGFAHLHLMVWLVLTLNMFGYLIKFSPTTQNMHYFKTWASHFLYHCSEFNSGLRVMLFFSSCCCYWSVKN